MFYSQYPYSYEGRSQEYQRNPDPSFLEIYTEMIKYGFSTTEIPLSLSLQRMSDARMNYASGLLSKEEFEELGLDDAVSYRKGMTVAEAELLQERAEKEKALQEIYDQADSVGDWTAIIGGMITGSIPSITNFLPTVSAIPRLQQTLQAMKASKVAKNSLVGAADATAATAIFQIPYAIESKEYQRDYDFQHAAIDLAIGAGLGGTIGAVFGNFRVPLPKEVDDIVPADQRIPDFGKAVIDRSFTNAGKQVARSEMWYRARQNEIAKLQKALDQPIDVNYVPLATSKEIDRALETSISTTPDLDAIVPTTVQEKKIARDANNASEAGQEIKIFDTEETKIAEAGGKQILVVPLSKNAFGKYLKKEAKELKLRGFAMRYKPDTAFSIEGNQIKYVDSLDQKGKVVKGEVITPKAKDLLSSDATYENFVKLQASVSDSIRGGRPTHILLTKNQGDRDYQAADIFDKQRIEQTINENPTNKIQVDSFTNSFSAEFKKLDPTDLQKISAFNEKLRASRYQEPIVEKQLNNQIVEEPESTFEPTQYDPAKHDPILADANKELDAELANRDLTDKEAIELTEVDKNIDEMIEASDDLYNSVSACVFKNARV
jgi:hypothetical protein